MSSAKKPKLVRATGSRLVNEYIDNLPVTLTNDELLARGTSLVRLRDEERKAAAEFELHKTAHKNAVSRIDEERERLEQAIREKKEPRPIKVQGWADYDQARYREIRSDSGELINERALLAVEMQDSLPFGEEAV